MTSIHSGQMTEDAGSHSAGNGIRVLVVDDAPETRVLVRDICLAEGFGVTTVSTGEDALNHARSKAIDFIVLDVSLPGIDGIEVCRRLRTFTNAFVVMLSSLDGEADRLLALHSGADDYVIKPFFPRELTARMRVLMRRTPITAPSRQASQRAIGSIWLDLERREVSVDGRQLELTKREFGILDVLSRNIGAVVTHDQLLRELWGAEWVGDHHLLHIHVSNVRKKLGAKAATCVATVRGVGYRLVTSGQ